MFDEQEEKKKPENITDEDLRQTDMDIIYGQFPPNYGELIEYFDANVLEEKKAIFCYGKSIYSPFNRKVTPDVEIHEEVHSKQQEACGNPEMWYYKYINDPEFRLEQEVEAYGTQYAFIKKYICGS